MSIIYNKDNIVLWSSSAIVSQLQIKAHIRSVIKDLFATNLCHKPSGAPYLENRAANISISHTTDSFAIFFSTEGKCGIDIEKSDRDAKRIIRKFTNEQEVQIVKKAYPKNPELLIWCAKEAIYKMNEVEGAEFKSDFLILSATDNSLGCVAFGAPVICNYFECDNLLITNVLCLK